MKYESHEWSSANGTLSNVCVVCVALNSNTKKYRYILDYIKLVYGVMLWYLYFFLLPRCLLCRFLLNGLGLEARSGIGDGAADSEASSSVFSSPPSFAVVESLSDGETQVGKARFRYA